MTCGLKELIIGINIVGRRPVENIFVTGACIQNPCTDDNRSNGWDGVEMDGVTWSRNTISHTGEPICQEKPEVWKKKNRSDCNKLTRASDCTV